MLSNVMQSFQHFFVHFFARFLRRFLVRFRGVAIAACLALLLSGCVQYDVGVTFDSQHSGTIIQTVKLGDRLSALNGASAQDWLDSLETRAKKLGGKAQRVSRQELQVKIPFSTDKDFSQKFNRFFQEMGGGKSGKNSQSKGAEPEVATALTLKRANFLLGERNRLMLDVDLRSLGIVSDDETLVVNPGSLLDLDFRINGVAVSSKPRGPHGVTGQKLPDGMVWRLNPGQQNHIEASFWMPSQLGLSTLGLIGVIAASVFYKEKLTPDS